MSWYWLRTQAVRLDLSTNPHSTILFAPVSYVTTRLCGAKAWRTGSRMARRRSQACRTDACGSHRSRFQFLLRMRTPVSFGATGRAG